MIGEYKVPRGYGEYEEIISKSRFIGRVWPAMAEAEALEILKKTRERHRDASHNVFCYRIREGGLMRYSDDGEPSGTAGTPLLECFLRRDIQNFICISTRWFGGTLLGAGGLVRAYARSSAGALEAAGIAVMRLLCRGLIDCPYPLYDRLRVWLEGFGARIDDTDFGQSVTVSVTLAADRWDELCLGVADTTNGRAEPILAVREYGAL